MSKKPRSLRSLWQMVQDKRAATGHVGLSDTDLLARLEQARLRRRGWMKRQGILPGRANAAEKRAEETYRAELGLVGKTLPDHNPKYAALAKLSDEQLRARLESARGRLCPSQHMVGYNEWLGTTKSRKNVR